MEIITSMKVLVVVSCFGCCLRSPSSPHFFLLKALPSDILDSLFDMGVRVLLGKEGREFNGQTLLHAALAQAAGMSPDALLRLVERASAQGDFPDVLVTEDWSSDTVLHLAVRNLQHKSLEKV